MNGELPSFAPGGLAAGSQIAGYLIEEQIGRGGMAVVYRASDTRLNRSVALKILAPELAGDTAFRQRFMREMRAAASVDHPHIVPVFDAGEADGVLYIAMRYVGGQDLRTLLDTQHALPAPRVVHIIAQVASALDDAHARGLIHRDVKPGNMLIGTVAGSGQPDHVYLSDFGLSKPEVSGANLTLTGQFLGTLDYMAPEQAEGHAVTVAPTVLPGLHRVRDVGRAGRRSSAIRGSPCCGRNCRRPRRRCAPCGPTCRPRWTRSWPGRWPSRRMIATGPAPSSRARCARVRAGPGAQSAQPAAPRRPRPDRPPSGPASSPRPRRRDRPSRPPTPSFARSPGPARPPGHQPGQIRTPGRNFQPPRPATDWPPPPPPTRRPPGKPPDPAARDPDGRRPGRS